MSLFFLGYANNSDLLLIYLSQAFVFLNSLGISALKKRVSVRVMSSPQKTLGLEAVSVVRAKAGGDSAAGAPLSPVREHTTVSSAKAPNALQCHGQAPCIR